VSTVAGCVGGIYQDGYVKAKPAAFGDFYIKLDTVAPVITPLNIRNGSNMKAARSITLRTRDNLSGIKSCVAKIDGKWVMLTQDYKTRVYKYTFEDTITAGKHVFNLTVIDNKDNVSQYTATFTR